MLSVIRSQRTGNGGSAGLMRQSLVGFQHIPGSPPVVVVRLPGPVPGNPPPHAHAHDFLVLLFAHRADGVVDIDGRSWTVGDGDLFVIAPGQVVSLLGDEHEVITDARVVFFPAEAVRAGLYSSWQTHPLLSPFARGAGQAQRLRVPPAERAAWIGRFDTLDAELQARRDGYHEAALAHLTLLLVAAARLAADVAGEFRASDEPLLAAVFEIIERRYAEPVSLSGIAAEVALTPGHLTTVVRRRTGRTVQQWLTQRRLQQARVLLTGTDLPVAVISRRVGYPDVSYFIKRFRAEHDVTPARWRAPGR
jgi:AraC family transcriptional activator of pobA